MTRKIDPSRTSMNSRRQILAATGVSTVGFLAGCFDDDTETGTGDGLVANERVTGHLGSEQDVQFNPYNVTLEPEWDLTLASFASMVQEARTHGEYYPIGIRDWTIDEDVLAVEVHEALTWHNGDPVTADDLVRSVWLADLVSDPIEQYIDDSRARSMTSAIGPSRVFCIGPFGRSGGRSACITGVVSPRMNC